MRLTGLVRYLCACVRASMRGGGDMVYGCECEQDENSDYTCAEYIAY